MFDDRRAVTDANAQALGEMRLEGGDFLSCLSQVNLAADRRPVRRLWGSGRGRFRTRGRYASASVRGTKWLTQDACGGTLTRVEEGSVVVHDFGYRRDVVVRAGQSYFAEPLPRGVRSLGCTLIGSTRGDLLRGTAGRDVICGLGGNDILLGLGGDDRRLPGRRGDRRRSRRRQRLHDRARSRARERPRHRRPGQGPLPDGLDQGLPLRSGPTGPGLAGSASTSGDEEHQSSDADAFAPRVAAAPLIAWGTA